MVDDYISLIQLDVQGNEIIVEPNRDILADTEPEEDTEDMYI